VTKETTPTPRCVMLEDDSSGGVERVTGLFAQKHEYVSKNRHRAHLKIPSVEL
jgi:hypothetical protein